MYRRVLSSLVPYVQRADRLDALLPWLVGTRYKKVEVNLVNGKSFIYPMPVGRSFLKQDLVVDLSRTFLHRPDCERDAARG